MNRILLSDGGLNSSGTAPEGYKFLGLSDGTLGLKSNEGEVAPIKGGGGESINFEAFNSVKSGKIAQVLLDGKVREFGITDVTENGSFIDSLVLPDNRVLFLYIKEYEYKYEKYGKEYIEIVNSVFSKILRIENSKFIWTEESLVVNGGQAGDTVYSLEYSTISMIWDYKNEIVLVSPIGQNNYLSNPLLLLLGEDDSVTLDTRVLNTELNSSISIISHPQLERFIVSYIGSDVYYDYSTKVGVWDLNLVSDRGKEYWNLTEISSIVYDTYGSYPIRLNYINGVVTTTPYMVEK